VACLEILGELRCAPSPVPVRSAFESGSAAMGVKGEPDYGSRPPSVSGNKQAYTARLLVFVPQEVAPPPWRIP
jgi:hypothetical protein